MRRLLAIVLLVLLPLQFSWAGVAPYCGHEEQAGANHFGHHEHQHPAEIGIDAASDADLDAGSTPTTDVPAGKLAGAPDLDCGHCHGAGSMILITPAPVASLPLTALRLASIDEAGGAHAPTRPERPQWLPLA